MWRGKGSHCHLQILWLSASFCISCGCHCGIRAHKSTRWSAWSTVLPWESKSSPGFTAGQVTHSCRNSAAAACRRVSKQGGGGGWRSQALLGCACGCTFLRYRFVQADPWGPPSCPCCPLLHYEPAISKTTSHEFSGSPDLHAIMISKPQLCHPLVSSAEQSVFLLNMAAKRNTGRCGNAQMLQCDCTRQTIFVLPHHRQRLCVQRLTATKNPPLP